MPSYYLSALLHESPKHRQFSITIISESVISSLFSLECVQRLNLFHANAAATFIKEAISVSVYMCVRGYMCIGKTTMSVGWLDPSRA